MVSNLSVETTATADTLEPRAPGFRDMVPPVLIAPAAAALIFGLAFGSLKLAAMAAIAGLGTALLVGLPITFWMVDNARTGPVARTVVGAVYGLIPFIAAMGSGIVGSYVQSNDASHVKWVLEHGAPIPVIGVTIWPRFAYWATLGIVWGVLTMWTAAAFRMNRART